MRHVLLTAFLAVTAFAAPALAGDAIKLQIELPPDAGVLSPGEEIPIQVIGIDADGARVGFGGREVQIEASRGSMFVERRPYLFRYEAPSSVDSVQVVTVTAELLEASRVRGQAQFSVGPAGTYTRLVLRPRTTTVPYGGSVEIDVLAETRTGSTLPLRDRALKVRVRGPGRAVSPRTGAIRYTAPAERDAATGDDAIVTARLEENGEVTGEVALRLVQVAPTTPKSTPDRTPTTGGGGTPARTDAGGNGWPGGNLRIAVWRAWNVADQAAEKAATPSKRKLPKPGGAFVAPFEMQKLKIVVLRADVTSAELEWWTGDRQAARVERDGPGEEGPLRQVRNEKGQLVLHVELPVPAGTERLRATVRLIRADGSAIEEPLVFRRGRVRRKKKKTD